MVLMSTGKGELARIAQAMVAPGRGILAADESSNTIPKRFDSIGVESTPETRRDHRELLFRANHAMSTSFSRVIHYDAYIRPNAEDGTALAPRIEAARSI